MELFGLTHSSVVYLVEQLYGANYCRRYKFKYHKHQLAEQELVSVVIVTIMATVSLIS